jgi:hypothetical protein
MQTYVPFPFTSIRINCQTRFGNPDIYAAYGAPVAPPNMSTALSSAVLSIGTEVIDIAASDPILVAACPRSGRAGDTCLVRVTVVSQASVSGFVLSVEEGRGESILEGLPFTSFTTAGNSRYYTYAPGSAAMPAGGEIAFSMTAMAGSPVLLLASSTRGSAVPSASDPASYCAAYFPLDFAAAPKQSSGVSNGGTNAVARLSIGTDNPCYCGPNTDPATISCKYVIGVTAADFGAYTLVVKDGAVSDVSTALYDGVIQENSLVDGGSQLYDFTFVPAAATNPARLLSFTLSLYYGDVTVYARVVSAVDSSPPSPTNADFVARESDGSAVIRIARNDPLIASNCGGPTSIGLCRVRVLVRSNTASPSGTTNGRKGYSAFSIVARTETGGIINDGNPTLAAVTTGSYAYFRYTQVVPATAVVITTTPLAGPVDIYVTFAKSSTTLPPTAQSYDIVSRANVDASGLSSLYVEPNHSGWTGCAYPCTVIIGVTPAATASDGILAFSLLVRARGGWPVVLLDGQPSYDNVGTNDHSYYSVALPLTGNVAPLQVTLTPLPPVSDASTSTVTVYARVGDLAIVPSNMSTYQYSATTGVGSVATIIISATDAAVQAGCVINKPNVTVCSVTVLVVASSPLSYSLLSATGNKLLQDATPVRGTINNGNTLYYTILPPNGASRAQVTLTGLSGLPVLYLSRTDTKPTAVTATYTAGGLNPGTITLNLNADGCDATSSQLCTYYLAVTSVDSGNAAFMLEAVSNAVTPLALGLPSAAAFSSAGISYFSVYIPNTAAAQSGSLEIRVEALTGGIYTILANPQQSPARVLPTATCSASGCTGLQSTAWSSSGSRFTSRLSVLSSDPAWCVGCQIYIGVSNGAAAGEFSISAALQAAPAVLANAVPTELYFAENPFFFRTLAVGTATSVVLQLTQTVGEAVLYASVGGAPLTTAGLSASYSAGIAEGYRLEFTAQQLSTCSPDTNLQACVINIAVTAPAGSTASLSATVSSGSQVPLRVLDGRPTRLSVATNQTVHMYGRYDAASLQVSITELYGSMQLYVTFDGSTPSASHYDATATPPFGVHVATFSADTPGFRTSGTLRIAAVGVVSSRAVLQFSSAAVAPLLISGLAVEGDTALGQYSVWTMPLQAGSGRVVLSLIGMAGAARTYVTRIEPNDVNTRASKETYSIAAFNDGTLIMPSACGASEGTCWYSVAVWCSNISADAVPCEYLLTSTAANGNLPRLVDGVPIRTVTAADSYQYFLYEAALGARTFSLDFNIESGSFQLLGTDKFIPGVSDPSRLPIVADPSTFQYSLPQDDTILVINQGSQPPTSIRRPSGSLSSPLYTFAVPAVGVPITYSLAGVLSTTPTLLLPGQASTDHRMSAGTSLLFAVDVDDLTSDIDLSVAVLYGKVAISVGARGADPRCAYNAATGRVDCSAALWQSLSGRDGTAEIHLATRRVCNNTAVIPGVPCVDYIDFAKRMYLVSVTSMADSVMSITARLANSKLRLYDGTPITIRQDSDYSTQIMLYQSLPENGQPDLRITFATTASCAPFSFYLTSCIDDYCTDVNAKPSPTSYQMTGTVVAGSRMDLVITKLDAAYCTGSVDLGQICNYYLAIRPNTTNCAVGVPCISEATITPTLMSATANVLVDYPTLQDKLTTFSAEAAAGKYSRYALYTKAGEDLTSNIFLRLESCDTLSGYVFGYVCEDPATLSSSGNPSKGSNGVDYCRAPRRPTSDDFQWSMSTTPGTDGGNGRSRLSILSTPAGLTHVAIGVPQPNPNYDQARKRFGASLYELSITVGAGVYVKQPTQDGVGAIRVRIVPAETDRAYLTWTPPLVLNNPAAQGWNYSTYADNVVYKIYVAHRSFNFTAAWVTNTSQGAAGIMPTTACGLDRWEALVRPNITSIFTTTATSMTLLGLDVAIPYEVNIVAICDSTCIRANALKYGYSVAETGLSVQRVPYAVVTVKTMAPVEEAYTEENAGHNAFTSSFAPIGIVASVLLLAGVGFLIFKQNKIADEKRKATAALSSSAVPFTGGTAPTVPKSATRENADEMFKPRSPALRRGLIASSVNDVDFTPLSVAQQPSAAAPAPAPAPSAASVGAGAQIQARATPAAVSSSVPKPTAASDEFNW